MERDELDITKNIKAIELLKAAMLEDAALLYKGLALGADSLKNAQVLADIIIDAYLLAGRLGVGLDTLDMKVRDRISANIADEDMGEDLKSLLRHFIQK